MKTMVDKFLDHAFPIGGGSVGAIIGAVPFNIFHTVLQAAIFALVGGVVGWLVKVGLDYIKKLINK